jgi:hypothetical protein
MTGLTIITSSTRTPSTIASSARHPITTTADLETTAGDLLTTVAMASTTRVGFVRTTSSRLVSSRARRSQWATVRDALSVELLPATLGQPANSRPAAPHAEGLVEAPNGNRVADATPVDPLPKPKSATSRIELTIDSLRTYELVKPIPVFVEPLGERHYVAEVPDLDMTISASSLSEILIVLKDSVTQTYDELRARRNPDPEQTRQLKTLEGYIGRAKRGWLDRR